MTLLLNRVSLIYSKATLSGAVDKERVGVLKRQCDVTVKLEALLLRQSVLSATYLRKQRIYVRIEATSNDYKQFNGFNYITYNPAALCFKYF